MGNDYKKKSVYARNYIKKLYEEEEVEWKSYKGNTGKVKGYEIGFEFYGESKEEGSGFKVNEEGFKFTVDVYIPIKDVEEGEDITELAFNKVKDIFKN